MNKNPKKKGLSTERMNMLMEKLSKNMFDSLMPENDNLTNDNKNDSTLYFVRRGETLLDSADRTQGWIDSPLSEKGIKVTESLAKGLQNIKFSSVYVDNQSTIETSKIIMRYNKVSGYIPFEQSKDLREWYFGDFEGEKNYVMGSAIMEKANIYSQEELMELGMPKIANIIAEEDPLNKAEDWERIESRLKSILNRIKNETCIKGENILVVTHGLTIASILYMIDNSQKSGMDIMNNSVSKISYKNNKYNILEINNLDYVYKGGYLNPFSYEYN